MRFMQRMLSLTAVGLSVAALSEAHGTRKPREIKVSVTEKGFVPSNIKVKAGQPIVLVITRKTDRTCATEAVFSSLGKTFELPLNKPVKIALHVEHAGRIDFACGMDMIKAQVVVQ